MGPLRGEIFALKTFQDSSISSHIGFRGRS